MTKVSIPDDIRVLGSLPERFREIITPDALRFLAHLHREFEPRRQRLLDARTQRQVALDGGQLPTFLPQTRYVREGDWKVASIPDDLKDRRVEITGPVDRKMVINALNSGAKCYMADFEDSTSPTWFNQVDGQINLRDANLRTIDYIHPKTQKKFPTNSPNR